MSLENIYSAVVSLNHKKIADLVQNAIASGEDTEAILNQGLISAMEDLGQRFSEGSVFVPEMILGAMTVKTGLGVLKPYLISSSAKMAGTVVIGTVKGDMHDVGKNIVAMMLEGGGFKVVDIGVDQPKERFLKAVEEHHADIVGLSSLLSTCMPAMEATVKHLRANGNGTKIIVGGAPVTQAFADRVGAHGYGKDGNKAVVLAKTLVPRN
jgi:5-methyltetrahydrofolate--homocysteine methyltransferase